MKTVFLLLLFSTVYFHAQIPDADHDGIPDTTDACPTIAGVPENNGCPLNPSKPDCSLFKEKNKIKFEAFKIDHQHIEQIYNLINKTILDNVINKRSKKDLVSKEIYIKYINNNAYFDQKSCLDGIPPDYNFLITKFWNKNVLEYAKKKYNKEISLSTLIPKEDFDEFRKVIGDESFNYIIQYYDPMMMKVNIPAQQKSTRGISIPIVIQFKTPYKIEVNDTKNNTTYEYKNNTWQFSTN